MKSKEILIDSDKSNRVQPNIFHQLTKVNKDPTRKYFTQLLGTYKNRDKARSKVLKAKSNF